MTSWPIVPAAARAMKAFMKTMVITQLGAPGIVFSYSLLSVYNARTNEGTDHKLADGIGIRGNVDLKSGENGWNHHALHPGQSKQLRS